MKAALLHYYAQVRMTATNLVEAFDRPARPTAKSISDGADLSYLTTAARRIARPHGKKSAENVVKSIQASREPHSLIRCSWARQRPHRQGRPRQLSETALYLRTLLSCD